MRQISKILHKIAEKSNGKMKVENFSLAKIYLLIFNEFRKLDIL